MDNHVAFQLARHYFPRLTMMVLRIFSSCDCYSVIVNLSVSEKGMMALLRDDPPTSKVAYPNQIVML